MTPMQQSHVEKTKQVLLTGSLRKGLSAIASRQTWASDTSPCFQQISAENISAPAKIGSAQKCHSISLLSL